MLSARVRKDSTAGEDAHSHCVPSALGNTPPPLLWVLWGFRLRPSYAPDKEGGARAQTISYAHGFFCKSNMRAARKQGVQALHVECPIEGCEWHWRHNMRCQGEQQHPNLRVTD